jgi:hypothetical protein
VSFLPLWIPASPPVLDQKRVIGHFFDLFWGGG